MTSSSGRAPDDLGEARYKRSRDRLLADFTARVHARDWPGLAADDAVADVENLLHYKWAYGDGELTAWVPGDVADFLFGWCPRKLGGPARDWLTMPASVAAFLSSLGPAAAEAASFSADPGVEREFAAAMNDRSQFGMAKTLMTEGTERGFDLSSEDGLQEWMDAFNALSFEERKAILPDSTFGRDPADGISGSSDLILPPVRLPTDEQVDASAGEAPIVERFARLADYVAGGRKLTKKNNLTVKDGIELVAVLETGDQIEGGMRTGQVRSSAELRYLGQSFRLARKAGILRVANGKVIATKLGREARGRGGEVARRAVTAMIDEGPIASLKGDDERWVWSVVDDMVDANATQLLLPAYLQPEPVDVDLLVDVEHEAVTDEYSFPDWVTPDMLRRWTETAVCRMADSFELAGVLVRSGTDEPDELCSWRPGGTVALTDFGRRVVHDDLLAIGYRVPDVSAVAGMSAREFLETQLGDGEVDEAGMSAWVATRADETAAARDIANALRDLTPERAMLAFELLDLLSDAASVPVVRELTAYQAPGEAAVVRGLARWWLAGRGLEPLSSLFDPDDLAAFASSVLGAAATDLDEGVVEAMGAAGDHEAQVAVLGRLWRVDDGAVAPALAVIGRVHPVKAVAKAARKAAMQYRSRTGG